MDWEMMRQQWRSEAPAAPAVPVDELEARDRKLQSQVRRRDLIETLAAVAVGIFFALVARDAAVEGNWVALAFAALLVGYAAYVPLKLRRTRRQLPVVEHEMPIVEGLAQQRDAALAQARMLEQVWLWYLAPPGIGLAGLTLATSGATPGALAYLGGVAVLYAGIAWLNRYVARKEFRSHATALQRQIDALAGAMRHETQTKGE